MERVRDSCMGRLGSGTWRAAVVNAADFGMAIIALDALHQSDSQARRRTSTRACLRWGPQQIGPLWGASLCTLRQRPGEEWRGCRRD